MNGNVKKITETAVLLALLVVLQAVTKPLGQIVTGSCVNAVLAVSALAAGLWSGVAIALISPVLAFLLGIAPNVVVVPAIMVGNTVFVLLLALLVKGTPAKQIVGWLAAAAAKFAVLYVVVAKIICGVMSESLLSAGTLKPPMLKALPATFGVPQLITALIGGGVALLIVPTLRKALKKN